LLGRQASPQGLAGQQLPSAGYGLDKHHAIEPLGATGIPLQHPGLQRPIDRPAQHPVVVAQIVQPPAAGAARLAEITERPLARPGGLGG
jgi:hypothetical protein